MFTAAHNLVDDDESVDIIQFIPACQSDYKTVPEYGLLAGDSYIVATSWADSFPRCYDMSAIKQAKNEAVREVIPMLENTVDLPYKKDETE